MAEKHVRTDRSDIEIDTRVRGDVSTTQSHSKQKKTHMTNIYLMNSDDETIVDFVKDKEMCDKTHKHNKTRKECLWERLANHCKLFFFINSTLLMQLGKIKKDYYKAFSQVVCQSVQDLVISQRTCHGELKQSKSGRLQKK